MRKVLVLSIVALTFLCASVGLSKDKKAKAEGGQQKKLTAEGKQWREQLKAMNPEQQVIAKAKKAFEDDVAPWKEVRKIAESEKATKTMAAIDKILAAKEEQFKKKLASLEKKTGYQGKSKDKGASKDKGDGKGKKGAQSKQ